MGAFPALSVTGLEVTFDVDGGPLRAVAGIDLTLHRGRTLALVGESGCGKSITALAMMGLLDPPAKVTGGSIRLGDQELVGAPESELQRLRGDRIAIVFQEPMSALNPVMRIGDQVGEPLFVHRGLARAEVRARVKELLAGVGLPDPSELCDAYPHQLSGGMRQRVVIAMALACTPDVVIADEPTTALDVTLQAQILHLLRRLQREHDLALLFITHDLRLLPAIADEVAVMYAGSIVEHGEVTKILHGPRHPYTAGLLASSPRGRPFERLHAIGGATPGLSAIPRGCAFHPRCDRAGPTCAGERPALEGGVACFHPRAAAPIA